MPRKTPPARLSRRIAVIVDAVHAIMRRPLTRHEADALTTYIAARLSKTDRAALSRGFDRPATHRLIESVLRHAAA